MVPPPLHKTFPACPEAIGSLRQEVVSYGESLGVLDSYGLAVAVSETVTNVVLHAYVGHAEPGEIEVTAHGNDHDLQLTIRDHGRGMVPRTDSPGLGLGLPLVAHYSERFEVSAAPGGGTRVCMRFATAG